MHPHLFRNLAFCTLGALLVAMGVVIFLSPNHIVTGGPPGIAIILFHLLGVSKAVTLVAVNSVLVAVGARLLGSGYLLRTCYAIGCTAAFMEMLARLLPQPAVTSAPLLNSLYGGILIGAGLAFVFKGEAAGGGWSLLARLVARRLKVGVGQCIVVLDLGVIVASAVVFRDIESALWAGIGVYVTGVVIDLVLTGRSGSKVVHISTTRADLLGRLLPERLRESGTLVHCNTVQDSGGQGLMFLVVETGQVGQLNEIVRDNDPGAHVVVMDAVEFFSGVAQVAPTK